MAAIGGQLQFVVAGLTPGATVYVQASSNLSPGNWSPVATNVTTGTNLTISGLSVTNANYRFFRDRRNLSAVGGTKPLDRAPLLGRVKARL